MRYIFTLVIAILTLDCSPKLAPDRGWGHQRWVVVEMKGVPVQQSGSRRDAFISFEPVENKFTGNGGCNQVSGNYTVGKKELHFSEVLSTKMSCEDIEFETAFLSTLSSIDRYDINGNDLRLKRKGETLLVLRSK